MLDVDTLRRVTAFGPPATRRDAVDQLAAHLGAAAIYVFIPHPDVSNKLVPAPGFTSTLPSGRGWRALLASATANGTRVGTVAYPTARDDAPAVAYVTSGITLVVVGRAEPIAALGEVLDVVGPLLAALLWSEQQSVAARGELAVAYEATQRASALATALDFARNQAERATRVKDEFLAMLGHELRNPLAPMVTRLQMLRRDGGMNTHVQDILERQVSHMSRLVDDLLDVSRITSGKVDLRKEIVEVQGVIARAVEMARPMLEEKRSNLSIEAAVTGLTVHGDPARLAQVIANIVTNAAKYSDAEASISINAECVDDLVVIKITDTGIGIDADHLEHMFDQFVQVPQALDRARGGLGLGLAIVRSLVTMHGGHVHAFSAGRGCGSTFTVELPYAQGQVTQSAASAPIPTAHEPRHVSVLVVDDNRDAAEMLGELLQTFGYEPRIAHSASEALELLDAALPDLAVLDIGLPIVDGYELARAIRKRAPNAKLVAVTGYGQAADRERAFAAGFHVHLVKPVSIAKITTTLDQLLQPQSNTTVLPA